jgi:hypothetical protein
VRDAAEAAAAGRRLEAAGLDLLVVQHATFATGDLLAPLLAPRPASSCGRCPSRAGAAPAGPTASADRCRSTACAAST